MVKSSGELIMCVKIFFGVNWFMALLTQTSLAS